MWMDLINAMLQKQADAAATTPEADSATSNPPRADRMDSDFYEGGSMAIPIDIIFNSAN